MILIQQLTLLVYSPWRASSLSSEINIRGAFVLYCGLLCKTLSCSPDPLSFNGFCFANSSFLEGFQRNFKVSQPEPSELPGCDNTFDLVLRSYVLVKFWSLHLPSETMLLDQIKHQMKPQLFRRRFSSITNAPSALYHWIKITSRPVLTSSSQPSASRPHAGGLILRPYLLWSIFLAHLLLNQFFMSSQSPIFGLPLLPEIGRTCELAFVQACLRWTTNWP